MARWSASLVSCVLLVGDPGTPRGAKDDSEGAAMRSYSFMRPPLNWELSPLSDW